MGLTLQTSARNAACNAVVDLLDAGAGTATMTICEADNTVLSTHNLNNPAFGAATGGAATANTISDATAGATGTAAKCRWYDRDTTLVFEGTVTATSGGGDIELNSTAVSSGVTVSIEGGDGGGTITMPAS